MRQVNLMSRKELKAMMEVMEDMAISEKELKLLLNFVKDNLQEARDTKDEENRNKRIDRTLEHIQQYLED
jgi:hypothetical protein